MKQGEIYMMQHDFHKAVHPYIVLSNDSQCQRGVSEILMVYMTSRNRFKNGYPSDVIVKESDVMQDGSRPFKTGTAMTESVRNFKKTELGEYRGKVKEQKINEIIKVFKNNL